MTEREQVIADLLYMKRDCLEGSEKDRTLNKAVELLKAQEARAMTLDEVISFDGAIYMDEAANPVCLKMLYCYEVGRGTYGHGYTFVDSNGDKIFYHAKKFNKTWRCWTSRPTDEQREAVKWND